MRIDFSLVVTDLLVTSFSQYAHLTLWQLHTKWLCDFYTLATKTDTYIITNMRSNAITNMLETNILYIAHLLRCVQLLFHIWFLLQMCTAHRQILSELKRLAAHIDHLPSILLVSLTLNTCLSHSVFFLHAPSLTFLLSDVLLMDRSLGFLMKK